MAYLKKADVLKSIKSRVQRNKHGAEYTVFEAYLGVNSLTRKPVRLAAKSKEKLERDVADFYKQLGTGGDAAVLLTAYQSMDAKTAIDLLAKAGIDLSLTECVRRVLDNSADLAPCTTTLGDAYAEYAKWQGERNSPKQITTVAKRVGRFVGAFGADRLLSEITHKELGEYLKREFFANPSNEAKTTYNGNLEYIRSFLRWCVGKKHYIKTNPAESIDVFTKEYKDPEYMKPSDVEKLFRALEAKGGPDLADAILSFFCALRQEEILRASEGPEAVEIDIKEKYIVVRKCKGYTRGIKPRAFTIPDQALAWMKSMPDFVAAARTPNKKFRKHLLAAASEVNVYLPENAGRHTFCTMFEAAHHDANALTAIAGNTEDVRDRHYNGVAKPQDGRDYFAIMPSGRQAEGGE